jgi:hypothetical protein
MPLALIFTALFIKCDFVLNIGLILFIDRQHLQQSLPRDLAEPAGEVAKVKRLFF